MIERERELPWWAPDVLPYLETILTKDMLAFEWGSGRSTQWVADRVKFLHTVESQKQWYDRVKGYLGNRNNVELHFVPFKGGGPCSKEEHPGRVQDPQHVAAYVAVMDEVAGKFDFIIIDGLAGQYRVEGLKKALTRLKPGGYLLFDNIQSQPYRSDVSKIGLYEWEHHRYESPKGSEVGYTVTVVFKKPRKK